MPTTKETAKAELEKLVIRFREQCASYTDLRATQLADRIAHVDAKVDGLVFGLYGLKKEEVGVVEGKILGITP